MYYYNKISVTSMLLFFHKKTYIKRNKHLKWKVGKVYQSY